MKMSNRVLLVVLITITMVSLMGMGIGYVPAETVDPPEYQLFIAEGPVIQSGEGQDPGCPFSSMAIQSREVTINDLLLSPGIVFPDDRLIMGLPGGVSYTSTIDRVDIDVNGTLSLRGKIDDDEYGFVLLSVSDGKVLATIRNFSEDKKYLISFDSVLGSHFVHEIDPAQTDSIENSPPLIPPEEEWDQNLYLPQTMPMEEEDDVVIDVMIVYTPAAKNYASQTTGINSFIAQAMEMSQLTLDNSDVGIILRLVHSGEVNYTESGNIRTDLTRLTSTTSAHMPEVHEWRNKYGADLVNLFTLEHNSGGHAWILDRTSGQPERGFSITRVQQASWTYTMVHEMAHNMGCHHSKYQSVEKGPGLFSYSAGWRWTGSDNEKYASVMAYSEGIYTIVPYFSNPDILYKDTPTGHPLHGDNARTLREIKSVIAGYRDAKLSVPPLLNKSVSDNTVYEDIIITFDDDPVWRENILSVFINNNEIDSRDFLLEEATLTFYSDVFPEGGYYDIRIVADDYLDAILSQYIIGATDIVSFSFDEETVPAIINHSELTVDIEVAYGTDLTALKAYFVLLEGATAKIGEGLQVSGETENNFSEPVTYTIIAEDESSDDWVVTVTEAPNDEKEILAFSFEVEITPAAIDPLNLSVVIGVDSGIDLTNLVACFQLSDGAHAKVNGVVQVSGETQNDFSEPVIYTLTAADGSSIDWLVEVIESGPVAVNSVSLNVSEINLKEGEVLKLEASINPSYATNKKVSWSSDDESVALVINEGTVVGFREGTTRITVTTEDGGYTDFCKVTVIKDVVPVDSVSLNDSIIQLTEGEVYYLDVIVLPENATNKNVKWSVEDELVAKVESIGNGGVVTAVGKGETVITVTTLDGNHSAVSSVRVYADLTGDPPEVIETDPVHGSENVGIDNPIVINFNKPIWSGSGFDDIMLLDSTNDEELDLGKTISGNILILSPRDKLYYDRSYTVTIPEDAIIDSSDRPLESEYVFSFRTAGLSIPATGITLNSYYFQLISSGSTTIIIPTVSPLNATDQRLKWTSDNELVASVNTLITYDPDYDTYKTVGVVTPHNPGTTEITVKSESSGVEVVCVIDVFFGYGILRGTEIDVGDAILLLRHIVGMDSLDRVQKKAASVNGNGEISVSDAILILRKIVGLITEFPVETSN